MSEHLHHKLAVLRQNLLQGKLPRSVRWDEAFELIEHLGRVEPHGGEEFAFVVGSHRELFKRPHGQDLGIDEVSRLRRFLKAAGGEEGAAGGAADATTVVVIDHHSAHLYRDANAAGGQQGVEIKPYDPHHFHHHLVHRKEAHYQGDRVPEESSFYEEIAQALVAARAIVLVGHGVGKSSAVDALLSHLKAHHSDLAQRVKGVEVVDLSALSEPQIEAIVRRKLVAAA